MADDDFDWDEMKKITQKAAQIEELKRLCEKAKENILDNLPFCVQYPREEKTAREMLQVFVNALNGDLSGLKILAGEE